MLCIENKHYINLQGRNAALVCLFQELSSLLLHTAMHQPDSYCVSIRAVSSS